MNKPAIVRQNEEGWAAAEERDRYRDALKAIMRVIERGGSVEAVKVIVDVALLPDAADRIPG